MKPDCFLQFGAAISVFAVMAIAPSASHAQASDDANTGGYGPQPMHNWPTFNGGTGYGLWTPLSDTSGGGTYMEGVGVNNRQVDGNYSFALYAGSGSYDISRPLNSSITSGDFSILTRFDVPGNGPNLVNIRAGNNTSAFGSGELLSFGIVNGNELSYTDSTGFHLMPSGESRGSVWDWNVAFDAGTGAYSLSVTNLGGGFADVVTGSLEQSSTSVGSFAVINSSAGNNDNVIFDDPTFTVTPTPEPASMVLVGLGLAGAVAFRRRKS